jgi:hypothetical protein
VPAVGNHVLWPDVTVFTQLSNMSIVVMVVLVSVVVTVFIAAATYLIDTGAEPQDNLRNR